MYILNGVYACMHVYMCVYMCAYISEKSPIVRYVCMYFPPIRQWIDRIKVKVKVIEVAIDVYWSVIRKGQVCLKTAIRIWICEILG